MMVLKEANNAGTTGHVVTAVEKEQWHASACKLAMQMVKILSCQAGMLHLKDSIQAWFYIYRKQYNHIDTMGKLFWH